MATSKGIGHDVSFPLPNGLRHGQGKRVWANGATYEGRQVTRCAAGNTVDAGKTCNVDTGDILLAQAETIQVCLEKRSHTTLTGNSFCFDNPRIIPLPGFRRIVASLYPEDFLTFLFVDWLKKAPFKC